MALTTINEAQVDLIVDGHAQQANANISHGSPPAISVYDASQVHENARVVLEKATIGWVEGVFGRINNKERIIKCKMKQGRTKCMEYFTESEYERLVVEAHIDCRREEYLGFERRPFFCKYCDANFKDKNSLSYHRVRQSCPMHKCPPLKMYPTFSQGEKKELKRICEKLGVKLPNQEKRKREPAVVAAKW